MLGGSGAGVSPSSRTWTPEPFPAITAPEGSGTGGIHEFCAPEPSTVPVTARVPEALAHTLGGCQSTPISTIPCGNLGQQLCCSGVPGRTLQVPLAPAVPGLGAQNQELSLVSQALSVLVAGVLR